MSQTLQRLQRRHAREVSKLRTLHFRARQRMEVADLEDSPEDARVVTLVRDDTVGDPELREHCIHVHPLDLEDWIRAAEAQGYTVRFEGGPEIARVGGGELN